MSYELENLKREVSTLKYDLTRRVEDETFRRKVSDISDRITRLESSFQNSIDETNRRIDYIREHLNIDQP